MRALQEATRRLAPRRGPSAQPARDACRGSETKLRSSIRRAGTWGLSGLLVLLVASPGVLAQESDPQPGDLPSGLETSGSTPRSSGRVVDRAGAPIEGVAVKLSARRSGAPVPPVMTDRKGRWTTPPIAAGRYDIVLEKEGFMPSEGFVDVSGRGGEPIVVELRSLDEVTPAFAEADPQASVRGWVDKGNALLEQGRAAEARAEYEKALRYLEGERKAEVLRAVARTHYVEGDVEATVEELVSALGAAPSSSQTRNLYRTLMTQLGRGAEADRVIAALDAAPPSDPAVEEAGPGGAAAAGRRRPPAVVPAAVDAAPHRTGAQTVRLALRSPLGSGERIFGLYGLTDQQVREVDPDALSYSLADESFDLVVPDSYDGRSEWGLVVWISPTARGGVSRPEVLDLLERQRLIWVGANRAGNPRAKWDRIALALDAAHNVERLYSIDPERVVVAGYSGGGRTASVAALSFPEVFPGVVCWFGVDYFRPVPVSYKPGHSWPAAFLEPAKKERSRLAEHSRIALVTGERDFNRAETHGVLRAMEQDGFEHVGYFEIPDADHYHGLDAEWLERALATALPAARNR